MDSLELVSEEHSSDNSISTTTTLCPGFDVEELRPFRTRSLEQLVDITNRYAQLEVPKQQDALHFLEHLTTRRDAWFVEAGELGLLYFTEVVPEFNANFHIVWWDRQWKGRYSIVRCVLRSAFELFDLRRVSTIVPGSNLALRDKLLRAGFVSEGALREGWSRSVRDDALLLGVLREEADLWQEPLMRMTSSV